MAVGARAQEHQVRLRLVVGVEAQRVPDSDDRHVVGDRAHEEAGEEVSRAGVRAADRGHVDDLPLDQLDTILGPQDSGLGHAVVGVDVEAVAVDHDRLGPLQRGLHEQGSPFVGPQPRVRGERPTSSRDARGAAPASVCNRTSGVVSLAPTSAPPAARRPCSAGCRARSVPGPLTSASGRRGRSRWPAVQASELLRRLAASPTSRSREPEPCRALNRHPRRAAA